MRRHFQIWARTTENIPVAILKHFNFRRARWCKAVPRDLINRLVRINWPMNFGKSSLIELLRVRPCWMRQLERSQQKHKLWRCWHMNLSKKWSWKRWRSLIKKLNWLNRRQYFIRGTPRTKIWRMIPRWANRPPIIKQVERLLLIWTAPKKRIRLTYLSARRRRNRGMKGNRKRIGRPRLKPSRRRKLIRRARSRKKTNQRRARKMRVGARTKSSESMSLIQLI